MAAADLFVSVVAPIHEDGDILEGFVGDVVGVLSNAYTHFELILVDDGSSAASSTQLDDVLTRHAGVRVLPLSRHFGEEIAISAGLDSAIGDYVVVMQPDSDPPEAIPEMVGLARRGVGVVFGVHEDRAGDPVLHRLGRRAFHALVGRLLDVPIRRNATHFRVLSREAVNAVTRTRSRKRYLRTLTESVGYGTQAFVYSPQSRRSRPRRRTLASLFALASDIVVTNTTRPLRIVSWIALVASLVLAALTLYVIGVYVFMDQVAEGWTTIAGPLASSFSVLFLVLGTMGLYLSRLLDEQNSGPLYHVLDERNSTAPMPHEERRNVVTTSGADD